MLFVIIISRYKVNVIRFSKLIIFRVTLYLNSLFYKNYAFILIFASDNISLTKMYSYYFNKLFLKEIYERNHILRRENHVLKMLNHYFFKKHLILKKSD